MIYVKCTHVDSITLIPVHVEPASNGPMLPLINGLQFVFANESQYPTDVPYFYCTAPADTDIDVKGVISTLTQEEFEKERRIELYKRKAIKKACSLGVRETKEKEGVEFLGYVIPTDKDTLASVVSTMIGAELSGIEAVDFETKEGWLTLSISELKELAKTVTLHRQKYSAAERAHHETIDKCTSFSEVASYDVYNNWPV